MPNIKLHEATKQFKITNKLAMYFLTKKNLPVKSHSSTISIEQLELLREFSRDTDQHKALTAEMKKAEKQKKADKAPAKKAEEVVTKTEVKAEPAPVKEVKKEVKKEAVSEPVKTETTKKPAPAKPAQPKAEQPKPAPTKPAEPKPAQEKAAPAKPAAAKPAPVKQTPAEPKKEVKKEEPQKPAKPADRRPAQPQHRPQQRKPYQNQGNRPGNGKFNKKPQQKRGGPPKVKEPNKPNFDEVDFPEMIQIPDIISAKELSDALNLKMKLFEYTLGELDIQCHANEIIDLADVERICDHFNVAVDVTSFEDYLFNTFVEDNSSEKSLKAPVVTVMGHVDHGKTTLLDTIRKTKIADKEAGGITQSIGAYKVGTSTGEVIFIDTPGHEAFTNLRARGAGVTDIVILIVAANDGVKPQTIEAINHAKAAGVPMIVAINKIDMDGADANKVKQELSRYEVLVEDWGGDTVSVEVSAKHGKNIEALLEMIGLIAEMQELRHYKKVPARGTVIESRLDPNLGPVATILLQDGSVKRGDFFICGNSSGKIKAIFDDAGKKLKNAESPIPIEIMGFEVVPEAGDRFQIIKNQDQAKKVTSIRVQRERFEKSDEINAEKKMSLQNLFQKMEESTSVEFPIILKADNFGSCEVLESVIMKQEVEKVKINIIHKGIGNITESDIMLASTSGAIILGFNVKAPQKILALAKRDTIEIKLYNVIYHLAEDIQNAIAGKIEPEYIEEQIGKIEVLQKFKISKLGVVAGCIVREGRVTRKSRLKVMRGTDFVFEGELDTLRRIKDQVSEVKAGTECGIKIKNFNAIEIGDILESYELVEKK